MKRMSQAVSELCQKGESFVLVSIQDGTGSMPRHQGSTMLVRTDGSIVGSVGGGALEALAIQKAGEVLRLHRDILFPFDLSSQETAKSDMICGGKGTLLLRYYSGAQGETLIAELEAADTGTMYIFGGGHISKSLVQIADLLEIPNVVVEDRAEFITEERFPKSGRITVASFNEIPALPVTGQDMIVIVTHGHLGDCGALTWALQTDAGYIGMIGSARKRDMMYEKMESDGIPSSAFRRVKSPIGLPIKAQTPEEIAVAIIAEIIAFRRRDV